MEELNAKLHDKYTGLKKRKLLDVEMERKRELDSKEMCQALKEMDGEIQNLKNENDRLRAKLIDNEQQLAATRKSLVDREQHLAETRTLLVDSEQQLEEIRALLLDETCKSFQLRSGMAKAYFDIPFQTSNKGWHSEWFYCANVEPGLPAFTGSPPEPRASWNEAPDEAEAFAAEILRARIAKAIGNGLTGMVVLHTFLSYRVQPAKLRSHVMYAYTGERDETRERLEPLEGSELWSRVLRLVRSDADRDIS